MEETHAASPSSGFAAAARLRAAAIHLLASAAVAALAATLVFLLWYPSPFREISGGRELFLLVVAVDVVLGPLITFAIFNPRKPRAELVRDLAVVVLLQLAALAYGLHTVAQARPAVVALEGSRLRVVRSIDLDSAALDRAPPELRSLSLWGPMLVATRPPRPEEKFDAIQRGLAGEDVGMRPEFWLPGSARAAAFAQAALPLQKMSLPRPTHAAQLQRAVEATGRPRDRLGYLPILARRSDWSALVDREDGSIVGYVPIDGF
jgi:hypothetical protein